MDSQVIVALIFSLTVIAIIGIIAIAAINGKQLDLIAKLTSSSNKMEIKTSSKDDEIKKE